MARIRAPRFVLPWAVSLAAVCCFGSATAAPKKKAPPPPPSAAPGTVAPSGPVAKTGISSVLNFLDWGATSGQVMDSLKQEIEARWADTLRELRDPMEIDRALRRKATEFAAVEKTYVRFSGERTGYESSLIANDFVPNDDEAVLRVDDSEAQRYYFFRNDRLWKILIAYSSNVSRSTPFPEFLNQVQGKYGRPANVEWVTPKGGVKAIQAAHWDDPTTRLVAEDRTEFFGTYCMKFLSLSEGVALEESRKANGTTRRSNAMDDPSVASALSEITADTGAAHEDVVDRLTGTQHTIDMVGNRPDNEGRLDRGPVDSPTFPEAERGPKSKGKGKGKGNDKAAPKAGAGGAPATPSKPVIIY
jgi:hypothetical protein